MARLKWCPTSRAKRIGINTKEREREKANVKLVVKIGEGHFGSLAMEIIYWGSARSGRNVIRL